MSALPSPTKSTIVRSSVASDLLAAGRAKGQAAPPESRSRYRTDVPRTLVLAGGLWIGAVATAMHAGLFARLPEAVLMALTVLATFAAVFSVTFDASVRDWTRARVEENGRAAAIIVALVMIAAAVGLAGAVAFRPGTFAWDLVLLLGVPLSATAAAVAAETGIKD